MCAKFNSKTLKGTDLWNLDLDEGITLRWILEKMGVMWSELEKWGVMWSE